MFVKEKYFKLIKISVNNIYESRSYYLSHYKLIKDLAK